MEGIERLASLPPAGWAAVFAAIGVIALFLVGLYSLLMRKDVRFKGLAVESRENAGKEVTGRDLSHLRSLISSQYAAARNILQQIHIDIYEAGKSHLGIIERKDLYLLDDIARLVEGRIARDVLLDFVRNHFASLDAEGLRKYADAKALGYHRKARTELHSYSAQMPAFDLPSVMEHVPPESFKKIFEDVFASAIRISEGFYKGKGG